MTFSSGNGSSEAPYIIETATQLDAIRSYPGSHFKIVKDIDLEAEGTLNWAPVSGWSGVLDGGGFDIKGFNSFSTSGVSGFFNDLGSSGPATIRRVSIVGGKVGVASPSASYCAYLLPTQSGTNPVLIEDCFVSGQIDPGGDRGCGLVGLIQTSTITIRRCVSRAVLQQRGRRLCVYLFSGTPEVDGVYYISPQYANNAAGVENGVGVTLGQFASQSSFPLLDFANTWQMTNLGPLLRKATPRSVGGAVTDDVGAPALRKVIVFARSTGEVIGRGQSDPATGQYNIPVGEVGDVSIVALDDPAGSTYNDLIIRTTPT